MQAADETAVESDESEGFVVGQTNEPTPEEQTEAVKEKVVEDLTTDKAVDDITRSEADAALPKTADEADEPVVMKVSFFGRIKNGIYNWWDNPRKRYATLIIVAILVAVVAFVPSIRAMALNLVGVRSSVIVTAYDGSTNLPLENVKVSALGSTGKTNADGEVKLTNVKLGEQDVVVAKAGFATSTKAHYPWCPRPRSWRCDTQSCWDAVHTLAD